MVRKLAIVLFSVVLIFGFASFAGAQKHFEDVSIVFFPGGSEVGPLHPSSIEALRLRKRTLAVK